MIGHLSRKGVYFSADALCQIIFRDIEIIIHLQDRPRLKRIAAKSAQPQGRLDSCSGLRPSLSTDFPAKIRQRRISPPEADKFSTKIGGRVRCAQYLRYPRWNLPKEVAVSSIPLDKCLTEQARHPRLKQNFTSTFMKNTEFNPEMCGILHLDLIHYGVRQTSVTNRQAKN
jgi:hypothetical protein